MKHSVLLTDGANTDLNQIYEYIARNDSLASAEHVLGHLDSAMQSLAKHPNRGTYPPELLELGVREYREVFFKPYRIIYQVVKRTVVVFIIADGRRDMQSLLKRRLLGA